MLRNTKKYGYTKTKNLPKLTTILLIFIWLVSAVGIAIMIWRKRLALAELKLAEKDKKQSVRQTPQMSIRGIFPLPLKGFSLLKLAEKSLARLHIFILKTENSVRTLRERMRHGSQSKQQEGARQRKDSAYWETLKKK